MFTVSLFTVWQAAKNKHSFLKGEAIKLLRVCCDFVFQSNNQIK